MSAIPENHKDVTGDNFCEVDSGWNRPGTLDGVDACFGLDHPRGRELYKNVMMGDNREGWFAKPYESGRPWILMMHSGRELFDKSKRLIVKRKRVYLS